MEETATIETPAAEAQPETTEAQAPASERAQAPAAGKPDVKKLLQREKDDPNVQYSDAELDALEAHWQAEEKGKPAEPKAKEEEEPDETPDPKPKETPEELEEEPDPAPDEPDADTKAILKEIGAKNLKEASAKIKELRSKLGGVDAQAVARLKKENGELVSGAKSLWGALAKGDEKAIAFAEKTFGVKFAGKQINNPAPVIHGNRFIDPAKFIDPESAELVESAFQKQAAEIEALKESWSRVEQEREERAKEMVAQKSMASVVDEMADIASRIPELKSLIGFREIAQNVLNGKADSRLDVFTELFEIAQEEKCNLRQAYFIKRGRDTDRIEAQAEERGRKSAYNQKPNPSLSGHAGGKGEAAYQPVTEADLEKWANDHTTHPAHWYDKEGNLLLSKVPKRAQHLFK